MHTLKYLIVGDTNMEVIWEILGDVDDNELLNDAYCINFKTEVQ